MIADWSSECSCRLWQIDNNKHYTKIVSKLARNKTASAVDRPERRTGSANS